MASIRKFVEDFHALGKKLNVLVNNAGLFLKSDDRVRQFTKDNFELTMGTNHLGMSLTPDLGDQSLRYTPDPGDQSPRYASDSWPLGRITFVLPWPWDKLHRYTPDPRDRSLRCVHRVCQEIPVLGISLLPVVNVDISLPGKFTDLTKLGNYWKYKFKFFLTLGTNQLCPWPLTMGDQSFRYMPQPLRIDYHHDKLEYWKHPLNDIFFYFSNAFL